VRRGRLAATAAVALHCLHGHWQIRALPVHDDSAALDHSLLKPKPTSPLGFLLTRMGTMQIMFKRFNIETLFYQRNK
jgi:hypothetical protein